MAESLIEFWTRCRLDKQPYVHPDDEPILKKILLKNDRWGKNDATSFDSYITHPRFGDPEDDHLHLSLLPVPYMGDLKNAKIVILLLNPGLDYCDYWAEHQMPNFRDQLKRNLYQSLESTEYPFSGLDPQFCWYSGFMWWERKLRKVLQEIKRNRHWSYRESLCDLSKNLACVELLPYHSASFRDHKLIAQLPSVAKVKDFVRDTLLPDAQADKRTIIITRRADDWGLEKQKNVVIYEGGHTRGASLSPSSAGGKAILNRYGIS